MTEWVKVANIADIPSGGRSWYDFEEETDIVINLNGIFYCIADLCSHDGGPLGDGELKDSAIACPRHGACFDVRSGAALTMPAPSPIPTYAVKAEDGVVYVESPDLW